MKWEPSPRTQPIKDKVYPYSSTPLIVSRKKKHVEGRGTEIFILKLGCLLMDGFVRTTVAVVERTRLLGKGNLKPDRNKSNAEAEWEETGRKRSGGTL